MNGVLGGQHQKRAIERIGGFTNGDLLFLHQLQQGRLHLSGRAVHLVGQNEVGEDGALLHLKVAALLVVNHRADQVGGQQVGRELNTLKIKVQHLGQGIHGKGFSQTGHPLEQNVPVGKQPDEQAVHHILLADYYLAYLVKYLLNFFLVRPLGGVVGCDFHKQMKD